MHGVNHISTVGEPSYTAEYMIKEFEDLKKVLSLDYDAFPFEPDIYLKKQDALGDRGIILMNLEHPGYALQRLLGSENLAYFSVDYRNEQYLAKMKPWSHENFSFQSFLP